MFSFLFSNDLHLLCDAITIVMSTHEMNKINKPLNLKNWNINQVFSLTLVPNRGMLGTRPGTGSPALANLMKYF